MKNALFTLALACTAPLFGGDFIGFPLLPPAPPAEAETPAPPPVLPVRPPKLTALPMVVTQSYETVSLKEHQPAGVYSVKAVLNGQPCRLLFDTGASHTTFSQAFVAQHFPHEPLQAVTLSEGSNVTSPTRRLTVKSLKVGDSEFTAFAGVVLNLDHMSAAVGEPLDGILGMNVMRVAPFILSCNKQAFQWVSADERAGWKERALYGELNDQGGFMINARLLDQIVPLVIDSGANKSFASESHWPQKQKRTTHLAMTDINSAAPAAPREYAVGVASILSLGPGVILREVAPVLFETERYGIFGTDLLRRIDLLIDAPVNRVYAVDPK